MKAINKETLDEWLFDYFENNLSQADRTQLTDFLKNNPIYKADYESWKQSYITEPEIAYPKAGNLLKNQNRMLKYGKKYAWISIALLLGLAITYFLASKPIPSDISNPGKLPDITS